MPETGLYKSRVGWPLSTACEHENHGACMQDSWCLCYCHGVDQHLNGADDDR